MKASSMQNHFDVIRSKCRQTKPIVWATLLILMSRHADRSSSFLYLADLRSVQYGCKFATVVTERVNDSTVCIIMYYTSDMHVILRSEPELMCACAIRCFSKFYCKV